MMKFVICTLLLVNLLFVGVQCKPVEDAKVKNETETAETETAAKPKTLQPGDTYTKTAEMFEPSGSGYGSGSDEVEYAETKVYCPPDFVKMWMEIFDQYPDKCMVQNSNGDYYDNSEQELPNS